MNQQYMDAWGRPLMPPQQYNPYQPPPMHSVSRKEYEDLLNMVGKLGERFNGETNQNTYAQSNNVGNVNVPQTLPQTTQTALIPVTSENEAWNYPNDLNGNKQFFIDISSMTIYAKWVDSNIDLQRAVAKLQMITGDMTGTEIVQVETVDVAEMIKGVDEKISDLFDEITETKALIGAANVFQTTKSKPKAKPAKKAVLQEVLEDEY